MIFIAKNEDDVPTWKLALEGKKTVTRRLRPLPKGKRFAIQPGRGKFAVCKAEVISYINSMAHFNYFRTGISLKEYKEKEAHLEGFNSWEGLMDFFKKNGIQFNDTYRIEFKIIKE